MKKQIVRLTVFDDAEPVAIRVYSRKADDDGAPFEIRVDGQQWATCESGIEVDDEIAEIIKLYHYSFFPRI